MKEYHKNDEIQLIGETQPIPAGKPGEETEGQTLPLPVESLKKPMKSEISEKADEKISDDAYLTEGMQPFAEEETEKILGGLTSEDVQDRMKQGLVNTPVESPTKSVRQIVLSNIFTYFNIIFFILSIGLICVGSFNNLTFLGVVAVNTAIGIVQEINSKRTLDKLTLMSQPRAAVMRNGEEVTIRTEKLVKDDVVIFSAGNQICADAVVISGEVQVNESLVTGESDEIIKHAGDELLSGSFIVSGKCFARLEKVGAESFVSKLTLDAKKEHKKQPPGMMRSLNRLVQVIGVLIIPLGFALFFQQKHLLNLATKLNIETTTAALVGMIPEGLYLLANVALAVSVVKLAKKETLVHDLKCIETLARVDVLCVDKTGTITEDKMQFRAVVPFEESGKDREELERLLADFVGNMSADNVTMETLKAYFSSENIRKAEEVAPFSSEVKTSAAAFMGGEKYILGAPEFILGDQYVRFQERIEDYSKKGNRVLLFAGTENLRPPYGKTIPLGLVLLGNPIRSEAKETFGYFTQQGVTIKVISGDNPLTVAAAAEEAGIPDAEKAIDLSKLSSDEELCEAALNYTVFGRVKPEQKRRLVQILKQAKHTVAMTGDGVNDVLALKEADCSIAMASGSDVACQVSNLVLMNSNFASMPSVVAEGRQVINNLELSASLFLVKNIFSFVLSLISIFVVFAYPLTPSQVSLISGVTIGIPAFFLALEPNEERVKGKFLRNVLFRALPAAVTDLLIVMGVVLFSMAYPVSMEVKSTVSTVLIGLVGFGMLYRICKPFNWFRIVLLAGLAVVFVLAMVLFPWIFTLYPLDFGGWLLLIVFGLLVPVVFYFVCIGIDKLAEGVRWLKKKIKE